MTAAEFKKKWSRYQGKETSAYQGHFDDLCRLLGQQTPAEADPSGSDFFCFQKRVVKDAELFDLKETPEANEPTERGFADVWKKGHFAWEYKGKKKNLDEAYPRLEPRDADCAAKLKERTLTKLYNERPAWLDLAHKKLDAAVAAAYGWPADLTDEQILERLLALNLERAAEEAHAAKARKQKSQRDKSEHEMI